MRDKHFSGHDFSAKESSFGPAKSSYERNQKPFIFSKVRDKEF